MADMKALAKKPGESLDNLGEQLQFYVKAVAWTPRTIRRYKKEIARLLAEVTLGSGSLAVIGGTVGDIHADVCSQCHPFYTGKQKILDTGGRVARFEARYGKKPAAK